MYVCVNKSVSLCLCVSTLVAAFKTIHALIICEFSFSKKCKCVQDRQRIRERDSDSETAEEQERRGNGA